MRAMKIKWIKNLNSKMSDKTSNKIEKPWSVLSGPYRDIIRVVREESGKVYTKSFERQYYETEWSSSSTQRFKTAREAIACYCAQNITVPSGITSSLIQNFPIAMRQEYLQSIHDILYTYSQSQPKYTGLRIPSSGRIGEGSSLKSKSSIPNFGKLHQHFESKRKKDSSFS